MAYNEPRKYKSSDALGDATLQIETDAYDSNTKTWESTVSIDGAHVCVISYPDLPAFIKELNDIIYKYRI